MKPLAKMIKNAVLEIVVYAVHIVLLLFSGIVLSFMISIWFSLLFLPCGFFCYLLYRRENDLKDYLISI